MTKVSFENLEDWQKLFYNLNNRVGNDAWGARIEASGTPGKERMRIFINNDKIIDSILEITNGVLGSFELVFTKLDQEYYISSIKEKTEPKEESTDESRTDTSPERTF